MKTEKGKSLITYLFFLLIAFITLLWGRELSASQDNIRVWDWYSVLILLTGIPFILWQKESGLPEVWDKEISNRRRIWLPLLTGLFFGALDVLVIKFILHPEPYTELPPFLQPFPYSIFLYTSGAFEVEVFYRLIPLTLLLFLVGKKILHGKYDYPLFLLIAALTAIREPLEQWPQGATWFLVYSVVSGFLFNFIQALFYRNAGFLASLLVRLGHYLLWHILLGIYVEYVELPT